MATTKNIQSIERAFAILELFQQTDRGELSVKEISEALGLNKSTAFGLINTLASLGCLQQNRANQKYMLGLKLLNLASTVRTQNLIGSSVHPYLERLNHQYNETVHCAVRNGDGVIYIDKVDAGFIHINSQVGSQNDFHCTGVGKCILAWLPASTQERILAGNLRSLTYNTITNALQLREELKNVRERGYATDNEEITVGLSCAAVPVFSNQDEVACAISVSGMTSRIRVAMENGLVGDLKRTATAISREIFGYEYDPMGL